MGERRYGNINLYGRPKIPDPEGGTATVKSMGVEFDGRHVLLPRAEEGRILSEDEAVERYLRTGKRLGDFDTREESDAYGKKLHEDYEAGKYENPAKDALLQTLRERRLQHE